MLYLFYVIVKFEIKVSSKCSQMPFEILVFYLNLPQTLSCEGVSKMDCDPP